VAAFHLWRSKAYAENFAQARSHFTIRGARFVFAFDFVFAFPTLAVASLSAFCRCLSSTL
jgi:hypothetical protein